jgi:hypothetical protein
MLAHTVSNSVKSATPDIGLKGIGAYHAGCLFVVYDAIVAFFIDISFADANRFSVVYH